MKLPSSANATTLTVLAMAALFTASTTGCGESASSSGTIDANTTLNGSLQSTETNLGGTGSVVFNSPLSGISSKNSYALAFTLPEGASLTLKSNSTRALENGLAVTFSRSGSSLSVKLKVASTETDVSSKFSGVNAGGSLSFQIDVHNDESPAHILVWGGSDFSESAAILNSEDAEMNAPGNGSGSYWGLELANATVTRAQVGPTKFNE